jgi:hypothetical protein
MLAIIIDSPVPKTCAFGLELLQRNYVEQGLGIPKPLIIQMMEHHAPVVKSYISDKVNAVLEQPDDCDPELFLYYTNTLLFLPNKYTIGKTRVYELLPRFAGQYREHRLQVEEMLLDLGGSNTILDSERALVALAKIRKEAV